MYWSFFKLNQLGIVNIIKKDVVSQSMNPSCVMLGWQVIPADWACLPHRGIVGHCSDLATSFVCGCLASIAEHPRETELARSDTGSGSQLQLHKQSQETAAKTKPAGSEDSQWAAGRERWPGGSDDPRLPQHCLVPATFLLHAVHPCCHKPHE